MPADRSIEKAADLLNSSRRVVAFSGAGMSEESGIPTFRDPGGLWDRYDPGELGGGDIFSSLSGGGSSLETTTRFVSEFVSVFEKAQANPGHRALRELEEIGLLRSVITQNIDSLHHVAGNTRVIEVHGNVCRMVCLGCGGKVMLGRDEFIAMGRRLVDLLEASDLGGVFDLVRGCDCGGVRRLDVVAFGEPVQELHRAYSEAEDCDLMLVLGTSGVVYPAASIPPRAKQAGAALVEINATGSYFPGIVDLGITGKTGEVLPRIVDRVRELRGQR
jgi:NAD-dependent deacetylase